MNFFFGLTHKKNEKINQKRVEKIYEDSAKMESNGLNNFN